MVVMRHIQLHPLHGGRLVHVGGGVQVWVVRKHLFLRLGIGHLLFFSSSSFKLHQIDVFLEKCLKGE